jgi:hypothetical protein
MRAAAGKTKTATLKLYGSVLTEHKSNPRRLYCRLTRVMINNLADEAERHIRGRKFKFALSCLSRQTRNALLADEEAVAINSVLSKVEPIIPFVIGKKTAAREARALRTGAGAGDAKASTFAVADVSGTHVSTEEEKFALLQKLSDLGDGVGEFSDGMDDDDMGARAADFASGRRGKKQRHVPAAISLDLTDTTPFEEVKASSDGDDDDNNAGDVKMINPLKNSTAGDDDSSDDELYIRNMAAARKKKKKKQQPAAAAATSKKRKRDADTKKMQAQQQLVPNQKFHKKKQKTYHNKRTKRKSKQAAAAAAAAAASK